VCVGVGWPLIQGLFVKSDRSRKTPLIRQRYSEGSAGSCIVRAHLQHGPPDALGAAKVFVAFPHVRPKKASPATASTTGAIRCKENRCRTNQTSTTDNVSSAIDSRYILRSVATSPKRGIRLDVGARMMKNHAPTKPRIGRRTSAWMVAANSRTIARSSVVVSATVVTWVMRSRLAVAEAIRGASGRPTERQLGSGRSRWFPRQGPGQWNLREDGPTSGQSGQPRCSTEPGSMLAAHGVQRRNHLRERSDRRAVPELGPIP
jgi:hypothetical protein